MGSGVYCVFRDNACGTWKLRTRSFLTLRVTLTCTLCAVLCAQVVGDARDDWKILRGLSEVLGVTLPVERCAPSAPVSVCKHRSGPALCRAFGRRVACSGRSRASGQPAEVPGDQFCTGWRIQQPLKAPDDALTLWPTPLQLQRRAAAAG